MARGVRDKVHSKQNDSLNDLDPLNMDNKGWQSQASAPHQLHRSMDNTKRTVFGRSQEQKLGQHGHRWHKVNSMGICFRLGQLL